MDMSVLLINRRDHGRVCALVAQINTGMIVGHVADPQGLVVSGAEATLTSKSTVDLRRAHTAAREARVIQFALAVHF